MISCNERVIIIIITVIVMDKARIWRYTKHSIDNNIGWLIENLVLFETI